MKTIEKNLENEMIIKNSRFITNIYKVYDKKEVDSYLDKVKEQYPKANHYCYAYKIQNQTKSSDDKEPTGTAGAPILNVIEKEDLNNILVITTRYFGGIKLGAGGLIRAYTKSVTETLKQATYKELTKGYKVFCKISYPEEKQIMRWLKDENLLEKKYEETVELTFLIEEQDLEKLGSISYEIVEDCIIEKNS